MAGDYLFFRSQNPSVPQWNDLWYTDGTPEHVYRACGLGFGCRNPNGLTTIEKRLYMQADKGSGSELVVFP